MNSVEYWAERVAMALAFLTIVSVMLFIISAFVHFAVEVWR